MRLFVGSNGGSCPSRELVETGQGGWEREALEGWRCFTAAYSYKGASEVYENPKNVLTLLDSGAFSDPPEGRLTFAQGLERQLKWETIFARKMNDKEWRAYGLASYDYLIDEVWADGIRFKQRWSVAQAQRAVKETVEAAYFLSQHRDELFPRKLFLGCQGVDSEQYFDCVKQILSFAKPGDAIALGGWCIMGMPRYQSWLPEFHRTLRLSIPAIAQAGIKHVHLYGVLWEPATAVFAYNCHQNGITCSTDSCQPITACKRSSKPNALKKAGARKPYWKDNVTWWHDKLANVCQSKHYRNPHLGHYRQLGLWEAS